MKGTRLRAVDRVRLERDGAVGNRRFFVVDARDRMVNGKQLGGLQTIRARYTLQSRALRLDFGAQGVVEDLVQRGRRVEVRFFSGVADGWLVDGPWSEALSEYLGRPLRLVESADGSAVDRRECGPVSLVSRASIEKLAEMAGQPSVDSRRFRMLIEIDGVDAHAEDRWVGRQVRIGDVLVEFTGHVGRCLVTSRDPDSGVIDLPTLDILGDYRRDLETTEPLPCGIYGEVRSPGEVRVGDAVSITSRA